MTHSWPTKKKKNKFIKVTCLFYCYPKIPSQINNIYGNNILLTLREFVDRLEPSFDLVLR